MNAAPALLFPELLVSTYRNPEAAQRSQADTRLMAEHGRDI